MRIFLMLFFFILLFGIIALGVIFGMENTTPVSLILFEYHTQPIPLWLLLLFAFLLGVLVSILYSSVELYKLSRRYRAALKKFHALAPPHGESTRIIED